MAKKEKYLVSPDINNKSLITKLNGFDEKGNKICLLYTSDAADE